MGHMADEVRRCGFTAVGGPDIDCLNEQPQDWDIFITNPPFNGNKKFFSRAIELGKPFALLCRLEHASRRCRGTASVQRRAYPSGDSREAYKLHHPQNACWRESRRQPVSFGMGYVWAGLAERYFVYERSGY